MLGVREWTKKWNPGFAGSVGVLACWLLCGWMPGFAVATVPVIGLSEIEVGMEGEWHTVVQGMEIRKFPLRVLGVSENFIAPKQPVILCEAIDSENILSGPVAGMSGSPVYINGRLAGAYAYGFLWPKQQAVIGVTPIDAMLKVVEDFPPVDVKERYRKAGKASEAIRVVPPPGPPPVGAATAELPDRVMGPLPTPLFVSGIQPQVLQHFDSEIREMGMHWVQAPASSSGGSGRWTESESLNLEPGMPVAGVLMDGDFSVTGVGTVTWKDGDRLLGFGHPFFGSGNVEIPMAAAKVITVVRAVNRSFKLAEAGPVVGSIYQDRLTAIAGEVGRVPPTTSVEYEVVNAQGQSEVYSAKVCELPELSPVLVAVGLLQSLTSALDAEAEQTIYLDVEMDVDGEEPVRFQNVAAGADGAQTLAVQVYRAYNALTQNPFRYPRIHSVRCKARLVPQMKLHFFDQVTVESAVPAPGETLDLEVRVRSYLGMTRAYPLSIPIPIGTKKEVLTVFIADANAIQPDADTLIRMDMNALNDVVRQVNEMRSQQGIYVRLLRKSKGVQLQGESLHDLPPSMLHLYSTPKNAQYSQTLEEVSLWENRMEVDGVFIGSYRLDVEIR